MAGRSDDPKTPTRPSARSRIHKGRAGHIAKSQSQSQLQSQPQSSFTLLETSQNQGQNLSQNSLTKGNSSLFDDTPKRKKLRISRAKKVVAEEEAAEKAKQVEKADQTEDEERTEDEQEEDADAAKETAQHIEEPQEPDVDPNVTKTYKLGVRSTSMRKHWAPLPPDCFAKLESVLDMFIEPSMATLKFKSSEEELEFRSLVKKQVLAPFLKRFKNARLPTGVKESHLNQEQLELERLRLESNYDANLKQLEGLKVQLQEEKLRLAAEQKYTKQYESRVNHDLKRMSKSLDQLQDMAGCKPLTNELDIHHSLGLEDSSHLVASSLTETSGYDIDEDEALKQRLNKLQQQLTSISDKAGPLINLQDTLDRLHNLLSLAE